MVILDFTMWAERRILKAPVFTESGLSSLSSLGLFLLEEQPRLQEGVGHIQPPIG
jgi:hypothetical protein